MRSRLCYLLFFLLAFSVPLRAQIDPIPNLSVQPIPLPGGDIFPPYGLYNQFFPGHPNATPPRNTISTCARHFCRDMN